MEDPNQVCEICGLAFPGTVAFPGTLDLIAHQWNTPSCEFGLFGPHSQHQSPGAIAPQDHGAMQAADADNNLSSQVRIPNMTNTIAQPQGQLGNITNAKSSDLTLPSASSPSVRERQSSTRGTTPTGQKGDVECEVCHKMLKSKQSLKQHMRTHSKDKLCCDRCDFTCSYPQGLKQHQNAKHGNKLHKCSYCENSFNDAANLIRHRKNIHKINGKKSSNETPQINHKYPHMKVQEDEDNNPLFVFKYTCPLCKMGHNIPGDHKSHVEERCPDRPKETDSRMDESGYVSEVSPFRQYQPRYSGSNVM